MSEEKGCSDCMNCKYYTGPVFEPLCNHPKYKDWQHESHDLFCPYGVTVDGETIQKRAKEAGY